VRAVYLADCGICHGADGRGTNRGPSLQGAGRALVDYELTTGRMPIEQRDDVPRRSRPSYRQPLLQELVEYTTGLTGGGPDIPGLDLAHADLGRGGQIYRQQCAACHAWAGTGGALLRREAPPLGAATEVQVAEAVRAGPGLMPAFGPAAVDDQDLNALVAYVRTLDGTNDRGGDPLWHLGPIAEGGVALVVGLGVLTLATRWIGERA
jgi:ubiquinol-cytochrome c reductase cytochrome c subunit